LGDELPDFDLGVTFTFARAILIAKLTASGEHNDQSTKSGKTYP